MITFVSAFYIIHSKFPPDKYERWFSYLLPNIKNFNLVVFTNKHSYHLLEKYENERVKIVALELDEFYTIKYTEQWKRNHIKNYLLNNRTSWELNMLWNEKVSFVKKARDLKMFDTDWYGWCDIGYFREEAPGTITQKQIQSWPSRDKILDLDINKIYYALANNNREYVNHLFKIVNTKDIPDIPHDQWSIAGGFFIIHNTKIEWWYELYYRILQRYFENDHLVKDDQIIIVNCVFSNMKHFTLVTETTNNFDHWFLFQRWLK